MSERLDKLLASTGRWSRKEAKALIRAGRVRMDGKAVLSPETKADPDTADLTVDGEPLDTRRYTWLMLNKPAGYLSATEDGHGPVVLDLLPPDLRRRNLFPVGRLDRDTTGLLLLTNEGTLAHALLSPRHHVEKVYRARVSGCPDDTDRAAFRAGLRLPDGFQCLSAELEVEAPSDRESTVLVTVREGKFHQVKRMLAARGHPVLSLERIRMGNLPLDLSLQRGSFRFLTDLEVSGLREIV